MKCPLEESLPIRVDAMRKFYSDINNFNRFMLGGLDIFGGTTSANLKESGMALFCTPVKRQVSQLSNQLSCSINRK